MTKTFLFSILTFFAVGFCLFPLSILALKPNISVTPSSSNVGIGEPVILNITVSSNYRLINDKVEVSWGDGQHESYSCVMPLPFDAPPQTCSFSAQHTYASEDDFDIQVSATSDEVFPEADIRHQVIRVGAPATSSGYPNPLEAENIVEFIQQMTAFFYPILLVLAALFLIIGAYVLITSGGTPSRAELGKKIIVWTLVSVAVMTIAHSLIRLIWRAMGVQ